MSAAEGDKHGGPGREVDVLEIEFGIGIVRSGVEAWTSTREPRQRLIIARIRSNRSLCKYDFLGTDYESQLGNSFHYI